MAGPPQRVDADRLLDNLVRGYRDAGRAIALDGRIGQPVVACPLALRRVLANLIDNALRYDSEMRVCAHVDAQRLVMAVVDSGPGIKSAQIDAVFAPLVRGRQGEDGMPGSGFGMAIARRLARSMQGGVVVGEPAQRGQEARLPLPLVAA
jgi:signal transduction histidine kinase